MPRIFDGIEGADDTGQEEAAVYLKAPPEDVVRLVESGQLKARKIDTAYRISRAALEEFMKG